MYSPVSSFIYLMINGDTPESSKSGLKMAGVTDVGYPF